MPPTKATSTAIQIIRADGDFSAALERTQTGSSEQLRRALMEFYVQPHYEFFEQGYFIGYQICKSYLAATGEDLKSLLAKSSAAHIIERSGYNSK